MTFAGVLAIVICVLVVAKEGRHDAKYVFTSFEPISGWPAGWSFCVGLLQAAYSTSSTGMVIWYVTCFVFPPQMTISHLISTMKPLYLTRQKYV